MHLQNWSYLAQKQHRTPSTFYVSSTGAPISVQRARVSGAAGKPVVTPPPSSSPDNKKGCPVMTDRTAFWRSIRDLNSGGAVNALSHFECCTIDHSDNSPYSIFSSTVLRVLRTNARFRCKISGKNFDTHPGFSPV